MAQLARKKESFELNLEVTADAESMGKLMKKQAAVNILHLFYLTINFTWSPI